MSKPIVSRKAFGNVLTLFYTNAATSQRTMGIAVLVLKSLGPVLLLHALRVLGFADSFDIGGGETGNKGAEPDSHEKCCSEDP